MQSLITESIHSESAPMVALLLILLGGFDLLSGWYMLRYKREMIPLDDAKLRALALPLFFGAALCLLVGLYMLWLRLG